MKNSPFGNITLLEIFGQGREDPMVDTLIDILVGITLDHAPSQTKKDPVDYVKFPDPRIFELVEKKLKRDSNPRCRELITVEDTINSWNLYDRKFLKGLILEDHILRYTRLLSMKILVDELQTRGFEISEDEVSSLEKIMNTEYPMAT